MLDKLNGCFVDPQRTLVVNGFWRSGTTWLQEYLANLLVAKRVFEPFQARAGYLLGCLDEISPTRRDYAFCNGLMPFISSKTLPKSRLSSIINQAQRGQLTQEFVLRDQRLLDFGRCFNGQVVVKYVRGALCLRAIADTFLCPVIHIYRDPRAVIASLKTRSWGEGAFTDFSLQSHLLEIDDGRYAYFKHWKNEINAIETKDNFSKIAAYYCLTEKYLADSFLDRGNTRFAYIKYEDFVVKGHVMIEEILQNLRLTSCTKHLEKKPSLLAPSTTQRESDKRYQTVEDRLFGWKKKLRHDEINAITLVVEMLGMRSYLVDSQELLEP